MHCFRYKLDHDYGLAPNPFWGIMSLAVCKGDIRRNKNLEKGDWIIGTGSKKLNLECRLIYAMKVEEIITFDEYYESPLYQCKKPIINGSLIQMYGDNIYHTGKDGKIIQDPCAHSNADHTENTIHLQRDTKGKNVILSKTFYYFGDNCPKIPKNLKKICCTSRNYSYLNISKEEIDDFLIWLQKNYEPGIYGDPVNWKEFNLTKMDIYED